MDEITLVIGGEVRCADTSDTCGKVSCVVVDANTRNASHLVVEPKGRQGLARLVPVDAITDATAGKIRLRYAEMEFRDLSAAEETLAVVPGYGEVQLLPSGQGWRASGDYRVMDGSKLPPIRAIEEIDLVPSLLAPTEEEEEEHGGDHVHATDGDIGRLHALCIDPQTGKVTHVLLKEHLWGHKEVKIPSDDVSGFHDGIHLNITKQQVQKLYVR